MPLGSFQLLSGHREARPGPGWVQGLTAPLTSAQWVEPSREQVQLVHM